MKFKMGSGAFFTIAVAALVAVVGALRWMGRNAAAIGAGIGTLVKVGLLLLIVAGMAVAGRYLVAAYRHPGEPEEPQDAPPPVRVASERVPLGRAGQPAALPPGGTHYHFDVKDRESAEALARVLRGDDHDE